MAKRKKPARTTYRIIRGIRSDTLGERYEAGTTGVDLSKWPAEVLKRWVERGIIKAETDDD